VDGEIEVKRFSSSTTFSTASTKKREDEAEEQLNIIENQYIAFVVNQTWQLGLVTLNDPFGDDVYFVRYMRRVQKGESFSWRDPLKDNWLDGLDILCTCSKPFTLNKGRTYKLDEAEMNQINSLFET
jgi:hypothetical protein